MTQIITQSPAAYALAHPSLHNGVDVINALTATSVETAAYFESLLIANSDYMALKSAEALEELGYNDQDSLGQTASALNAGITTELATFGDSTMYGADPANLAAQVALPPYAMLQNAINTFMTNNACVVVNYALSGTTLAQMLQGTDGSGLTFEARIAAGAMTVVYCNHGVNDAFGPNATPIQVYRAGLIRFIQIVRQYGKTPVLVTPHPCLTIGTFGSYARASATARFARTMHQIAEQHGVQLVDTFRILQMMLGQDSDLEGVNTHVATAILPDGVHGSQDTYYVTGIQLTDAILGAQTPTLYGPNQVFPASQAMALPTAATYSISATSRYGCNASTGSAGSQQLVVLFRVDQPGLDISLLHPIYSLGSSAITVNLDGNFLPGPHSQYAAGWGIGNFIQDFETTFARNISPGMHLLILTSATSGAISFNGLRSRKYSKPIQMLGGSAAVTPAFRQLLTPITQILPTTASFSVVTHDITVDHFLNTCTIEFTAVLQTFNGLAVCALTGGNSGPPKPQALITIMLNGLGYVCVYEASGDQTLVPHVLGAANISAVSHIYSVTFAPDNTVSVSVDGVLIGKATLTNSYVGGTLGLYKQTPSDTLTLTNVCRVWQTVD